MRRLGLIPWLAVWLVLSGLQVAAVAVALPGFAAPQGVISPLVALFAVLVLQGLKWPVTVGRLLDLGRPPEDAILLMVPLASIGLSLSLMRATPKVSARKRSLRAWEGRTLAPAAWVNGLRALLLAPALTVPALLAAGLVAALVEAVLMPWFRTVTLRESLRGGVLGPPSDTQVLIFQVLLGVLGLSALWLLLQLFNRKKASRASWLPVLILPPGILATVAFWPGFAEAVGPDQAPPGFFMAALSLLWWIYGGGVLGTLFIASAQDLYEHGSVQTGRVLARWRPRALGAVAIHGATVTVIFVGLQVLWIPGFVYALVMAFTVHLAMLEPDARPFRTSQRLTRGWWRPVFTLLALGVVPGLILQVLSLLAVDFVQAWLGLGSPFIDEQGSYSAARMLAGWATAQVMPASVTFPPLGVALGAAVNALCVGGTTAGLVWTFHERREQKRRKRKPPVPGDDD